MFAPSRGNKKDTLLINKINMGIGEKFIGLFIPVEIKPKKEKPKKSRPATPIETGSGIAAPKRARNEESPASGRTTIDNTPDFSDLDKIE